MVSMTRNDNGTASAVRTRRLALAALLAALALIAHYIESLFPPLLPVIPVRLGLSNVFVLLCLIAVDKRSAFAVTVIKGAVAPLISGAVTSIAYSVAGGVLSVVVMCLALPLYRSGRISAVGLSVLGAFFFNVAQLAVGVAAIGGAMLAYFPIMGLLSIPTGILVGVCAALCKSKILVSIK